MKRWLQFAVLVILPLLMMQSASGSVLCSALRNSCNRCSDDGSNSSQDRRCPESPSPTTQNQSACCQVGSPKPAQLVRTNPSGAQRNIAYRTKGRFIERIPSVSRLYPIQGIPPRSNSLQSLYGTFLI